MSKTDSNHSTDLRLPDTVPSVADVPVEVLPVEVVPESRCHASDIVAEQFVADGGCDSYEGTAKGTRGHWAFCQYLPGSRKPDSNIRPDGDGGVDLRFRKDWDIKTVGQHVDWPELTVSAMTKPRADRYALVNRIGERTFRIVGHASREKVTNQQVELDEYDRAYYRVPRNKLTPFPMALQD